MLNEAPATYITAFKLWWALTWRMWPLLIVSILGASIVLGIVLTVIGMIVGIDQEKLKSMSALAGGLAGLVLGLWVQLWIIRRFFTKGFGRYRLAVLEK